MRQQLDSFNRFITYSLQEVVDTDNSFTYTREQQYTGSQHDSRHEYTVTFGQLRISNPLITESDEDARKLFPMEARMRALTYSSRLYLDATVNTSIGGKVCEQERIDNIFIGELPVMLQSELCNLYGSTPHELRKHGECEFDQGGYFLINGVEKVIIAQERSAHNLISVHITKKTENNVANPSKRVDILNGNIHIPKEVGRTVYTAEVRSVNEQRPNFISKLKIQTSPGKNKSIDVLFPYLRKEIPVTVVLKALGITSDKKMVEMVCGNLEDLEMVRYFSASVEQTSNVRHIDTALDYIGIRSTNASTNRQRRLQFARDILCQQVIPHIGITAGCEQRKAFFIAYMVHRLLNVVFGRERADDRDKYDRKRVDLAGPLLRHLFYSLFKKLKHDLSKKMEKAIRTNKPVVIERLVSSQIITAGMRYSIATGNWTDDSKKFMECRTGVSQVLDRLTYISTLSHLRKINTPSQKGNKLVQPRQLHGTSWGILCPAETPEGQACGLVKNMALMAYISYGKNDDIERLYEKLNSWGVLPIESVETEFISSLTKIFHNGNLIGVHDDPVELVHLLRDARRNNRFFNDIDGNMLVETSVAYDVRLGEINIFTDAGRFCRPLLIVGENGENKSKPKQELKLKPEHLLMLDIINRNDGHESEETKEMQEILVSVANTRQNREYNDEKNAVKTWDDLLNKGFIEYIDVSEEETTMIATTPSELNSGYCSTYTHCEIHPSMILGVCASIIPFAHHNQSPRNIYQSSMGKQAIGVPSLNYDMRMETSAHVLYYPQKPLSVTKPMEYMSFRNLPAGQNAIVAIACYTGYNQEDSVILNQSAIDRGMFRSTFMRVYTNEEITAENEKIEIPEPHLISRYDTGYNLLEADGIIAPGENVIGNSLLVGKTVTLMDSEKPTKKNNSLSARKNEHGYVDKVMLTTTQSNNKMVKVRVRNVRVPEIGDKFASRHGQKGTCGMVLRSEDMMFTAEGICPDIIINPHAIPSRMTVGHLIECLLSKLCAIKGREGDATIFSDVTVEDISNELIQHGYHKRGLEIMYNGFTGRKFTSQIFIGPTYYQRLRHMVQDKIHSRSTGAVHTLTRQPVDGRAKDGGLRIGEMERDCMIAHGAAYLLQERCLYASDVYRVHVCDLCGLIAIANLKESRYYCRNCNNTSKISSVYLPYAAKLLFQELQTMGIAPRLLVV